MTRDLTSSNGIGSLFSGKARTVAAVAAFSGLALATTVSVQAAPAQDASADAPLSAVAAATPAAAPTVSLEPGRPRCRPAGSRRACRCRSRCSAGTRSPGR